PATSPSATIAKRCDSGSSKGKPASIGPHHLRTPGCWCSSRSRRTWRTSSGSSSSDSAIGTEQQPARALVQRLGDLALARARFHQLAEAFVASQEQQQLQRPLLTDARPARSLQIACHTLEFAAAVGTLAVDEVLRRRVHGDYAVDLAQKRVLACPETHAVRDRLRERCVDIRQSDVLAHRQQRRVDPHLVADRVDQIEARAEVLV